jgi:dipeptidyl aminopeptidase/acylaminoacyl peptidase
MGDRFRFSTAVCCVLALILSGRAFAAASEFQPEDLRRIVGLSDARLSPDGKQVAVIVSTPDWKTDKAQQEIDVFDAASGARRVLTWKRTGIASPKS